MIKFSDITIPTVDFGDFISLETSKAHLRVDHDDDDDIIEIFRDTAILTAMHQTGRMVGNGSYQFFISGFPENGMLQNIVNPATSIVIAYHDGTEWQTLDPAYYDFDSASTPSMIKFIDTVDVNEDMQMPIRITVTGGYTAVNCPKNLINGALLYLGHLYETRQDVVTGTTASQIPKTSDFLFGTLRIHYK